MVLKFRSQIWELERQMESGEFDSEKFEADWIELNGRGSDILRVLRDPPTGVWPKTLASLTAFRRAVKRFMATCYEEGNPEPMAKVLALCNRRAEKVIDGELLIDYVPEPKDGAKAKVPMGEVVKAKAGRKKSTSEKPARIKIIAFLTKHHEYANGSLLNQTPIGVNDLARKVPVSSGSASKFFKDKFGNYEVYKKACRDSRTLIVSLKSLNNEYTPKLLFENAKPQVDAPDE